MEAKLKKQGSRFSGADWGDQLREITLIGIGGIGSWTAFNLARIGHTLHIIDGDEVDETNVKGGQLYATSHIGDKKVFSIQETLRAYGCDNPMITIPENYDINDGEDWGFSQIVITGLDNMKARKEAFDQWEKNLSGVHKDLKDQCLFIDGRLLLECAEILTVQGNNPEQIEEYKNTHIFDDSEVAELDCTTKQSTFGAMGIGAQITATLCNWLTNKKLDMDLRDVPFYQRTFYPIMQYTRSEVLGEQVVEAEQTKENVK